MLQETLSQLSLLAEEPSKRKESSINTSEILKTCYYHITSLAREPSNLHNPHKFLPAM